jgi:hypothetical protein
MSTETQITKDVVMTNNINYVIKIEHANDKTIEMFAICIDLKTAETVAISLATSMEKEMSSDEVQIYRRDLNNQIIISRRDLGKLYHSKLYRVLTIEWVPVAHARIGVLESASTDDITPPVPSPTPPPQSQTPPPQTQTPPLIQMESQKVSSKYKQRLTLQEKLDGNVHNQTKWGCEGGESIQTQNIKNKGGIFSSSLNYAQVFIENLLVNPRAEQEDEEMDIHKYIDDSKIRFSFPRLE